MSQRQIYCYPTDTVWGLGHGLEDEWGSKEVHRIKQTPLDKPFSIMFTDIEQLIELLRPLSRDLTLWLDKFLTLETTLLIPESFFITSLPSWIIGTSSFIGVRVLKKSWLNDLFLEIGGPFTTTSLNLTGRPAITNLKDAQNFIKNNPSFDIKLIKGDGTPLSGMASTIIKMHEDFSFVTIRKGDRYQDVQKQQELFSA